MFNDIVSPEYPTPQPPRGFKRVADFEEKPVTWLWEHRVPFGMVTMLDGDPGTGKSLVALDLIAKTTARGKGWAIIVHPEDPIQETLYPRLSAAGADISKVDILDTLTEEDDRPITFPEDIGLLREHIMFTGARLVVVDSIMTALGGKIDSHKDQDIRKALIPLKRLAEDTGCAVVCIMHLSKSQQSNALYRTVGSIAFNAVARSVLRVVVDPDNPEGRVLVHIKSNLSKLADSLCFVVREKAENSPYVDWAGVSIHTRNELLSPHVVASEVSQGILRVLRESDKPLSTKEVLERLGMEQTKYDTMLVQLDRMVDRGLIEKPTRGRFQANNAAGDKVADDNDNHVSYVSYVGNAAPENLTKLTRLTVPTDSTSPAVNGHNQEAPGFKLLRSWGKPAPEGSNHHDSSW